MIDNSRAAVLVRGDAYQWHREHVNMSARALMTVEAELSCYLRHPATQGWKSWREAALHRVELAASELERRFSLIWDHAGNRELSELLEKISSLA